MKVKSPPSESLLSSIRGKLPGEYGTIAGLWGQAEEKKERNQADCALRRISTISIEDRGKVLELRCSFKKGQRRQERW